jgi:kynureninase
VIYLDHNATTPVLPEVLEAMMPYLTAEWGNPSSVYKFGAKLKSVIETAREQVAELIGAHPMDVIFTSCATESNNAAIAAALKANPTKRHIVTSQVEHSSVLNYCMALEKQSQDSPQSTQSAQRTAPQSASVFSVPSVVNGPSDGYRVTYLPVDREGLIEFGRPGGCDHG